ALAGRSGSRAFGPNALDSEMIDAIGPVEPEVQKINRELRWPAGFPDPRGRSEPPLYLPQSTRSWFGDSLTDWAGSLRVWISPTLEERAVPDLRAMLDLPLA
ncbi:MAG: hypothetical protein J2P17_28835, partial [Mycobacterium sp.]|nr:hypothetical protein [Mycobacterium sp.]